MARAAEIGGHPKGVGATTRVDGWWVAPMAVLFGLTVFIVYVTWAALQGKHYYFDPYLSPLYEPLLFVNWAPITDGQAPVHDAIFGTFPKWWPSWLPPSPALLILAFPALFRLTCYYYRKAYYRAYAWTPPACSVGGIRQGKYKGETSLLIVQNLHRYALYFALIYIPILYWGAIKSCIKGGEFGIGVGTVVLFVNATLIAGYTFGCHSFRHLVGGRLDCFTCEDGSSRTGHTTWRIATYFNKSHMAWAWVSLIFVMLTDLYIRLVSMGVIADYGTW